MTQMNTINYAEISANAEFAVISSPIHTAAINGEKSTIELLLKNNSPDDYKCDVNEEDTFGRTALVYTVFGDWYDCAEVLLRHKASVTREDRDKRTALHWASYLGKPKFVSLFLQQIERSDDCNPRDLEGRTPLHYAAAHENSKCLRLLLKRVAAAKIDVTDGEKKTALHWSAYYGYLEHVKILMKSYANPQLRDIQYNTLLHLAVANPQSPDAVRIVRHLLKLKPFFSIQKNYRGLTPLHLAVANESLELVKELCSAHIRALDEIDKESRSALHYAILRNNIDIVRSLISSRASLYIQDNSGATPLHYAAKNNNFELVAFLVSLVTKLEDIPDHEGRTALMWAASEDALDVLELMLRYPSRFNMHACDNHGLTPLHFACMAGNERCVTLLISKSSNKSQVDQLGQTPLFKACQQGNLDVVRILMGHKRPTEVGAPPGASGERRTGHTVTVVDHDGFGETTGDFDASAEMCTWKSGENRGGDSTVKFGDNTDFLGHLEGENMSCRDGEEAEDNGLHGNQSGQNGDGGIVQNADQSSENIENGVKMNESMKETISRPDLILEDQKDSIRNHEDFNGRTPLHFAAHAGHVLVCRWLLEKNVEPGKKDSFGRIALHGAALNGHTNCIDTILSYRGELVNERDIAGNCALHWAASNGHLEAVKILVNVYEAFPNFRVTWSNLTPLDLAIAGDQQDVTQFLIDHGALTIAGVQQFASDTIKRYLRRWLFKRKRKSLEPLLLKHRMLTREESARNSKNASGASDGAVVDTNNTISFGSQNKSSEDRSMVTVGVPSAKISNPVENPSCNQEMTLDVILPSQGYSNESDLTENDTHIPPFVACFSDGTEQSDLVGPTGEHFLSVFYDCYENALFEPCRKGSLDIIDSLIASGHAEIDPRDENSCTPLHLAAFHGHAAVCQRLLERGAVLGKRDAQGQTALHHAALNGHTTCIQLLLKKDPDFVHLLNRENRTALHCAASNGHLEAVALLLNETCYVQPNVATKPNNLSALDCARIGNHRKVIDLLVKHAAKTDDVLERAAKIITRNARVWLSRARQRRAALSATTPRQSGGEDVENNVFDASDVADDKPQLLNNDLGQRSGPHDLETKQHASDYCEPGSDFGKLESDSPSATGDSDVAGQVRPILARRSGARTVFQTDKLQPRAPDRVIVAGERNKILRLRRDWERIALVRRKIQAAVIIQNCFRKHLQRGKKLKLGDAGKSEKTDPPEGVNSSSVAVNAASEEADKRPSFPCRTHADRGNRLPTNTPPDRTKRKKTTSCKEKQTFESCFPPLLQHVGAVAPSSSKASKSLTYCNSGSQAPRKEERSVIISCRAPQLTKIELVKQWLEKDVAKDERRKSRANTATRRQNNSNRRGINKSSNSFVKSQSLPEDGPVGQRAIPNSPKTTAGLRSRSLKYPRPRSPMSAGHRPLTREPLPPNTPYPSPAAVSYNFALDTYHPIASRQGCKQPAFPYKTSTRVRPNSMKRGKNGWVHTRKFAEAIVSGESLYSS